MSDVPPTESPPPGSVRAKSVVVVNTGHGRGKSTSAFGVVLRASARDWKIAVVQFLKSGKWHVGEEEGARRLGVDWWSIGEGFTWESKDLSEDEAVAKQAWSRGKALMAAGEHRLVVFDELTYPLNWGWVDVDEAVEAIRARPEHVNVVITGRDAPAAIVDVADTVTEMMNVKHAFDSGIRAVRGIDY
jgi:cob(I)alamin adenosyltransferase